MISSRAVGMRGGNQGRLQRKGDFELGLKINTDIPQMEKDGSLPQKILQKHEGMVYPRSLNNLVQL